MKRPIYGYTLALIAFWGIAFFYTAVGTHHILGAPVPEWLKTISVICSIGLLIPVSAFVVNMFMTMRGSWRVAYTRFRCASSLTGVAAYLAREHPGLVPGAARLQPVHPLHELDGRPRAPRAARLRRLLHVGDGLLHDAEDPRTCRCTPSGSRGPTGGSRPSGFTGFFIVLTAAGLVQAGGFAGGIPIIKILPGIQSLWVGRAAAGTVIIIGQYIFAYNIWRTALDARKAPAEKPATADAAPAAAGA